MKWPFDEYKWEITKEGELHIETNNLGYRIEVFRINEDKSITKIAFTDVDGEREDYRKENQDTYIKTSDIPTTRYPSFRKRIK